MIGRIKMDQIIQFFLICSNAADNNYYPANAMILFDLAIDLKKKLGAEIFMVNLSGGIGIPYKPGEPENDILEIGEGVRKAYEEGWQ